MAYLFLLIAVVGLGAVGWWRGFLRVGTALLPLLCASLLLWLFGGLLYRVDALRGMGLLWPGTILLFLGLAAGYTARYFLKRRFETEIALWDRISGSVLGVLLGLMVTWLGLVYFNVRAASQHKPMSETSAGMARALNDGFVRWIPGIGAGSMAMTSMMEIASADEEVRQRAVELLDIDDLADSPAIGRMMDDPATSADIEAASRGSVGALYRLQKNPLVLGLADDEEFMTAVRRLTLDEMVRAVRQAEEETHGQDP